MDEGDKEIISLLTKIQATGGGGGAGCMGNASTSDVALGMTFSNSNGKNLIGTNTDNATVPDDAPFLPAQAFVDNITQLANPVASFLNAGGLFVFTGITVVSLSADPTAPDVNKGDQIIASAITSIDPNFGGLHSACEFDFTVCLLAAVSVNGILAVLNGGYAQVAVPSKWTIDLSGTNAAPTGQGLVDKAALIAAGWNVPTN